MNTRPTMQEIMINLVKDLKRRSTCQRRQQSCVIVNNTYTEVFAIGYNGRAKGEDHGCDELVSGRCGCTHAEANALIKVRPTHEQLYLLCTMSPCVQCARLIVNSSKISNVMYLEEYRDIKGLEILKKCGIHTSVIK